jgi:hypothetical protein
MRHVVSDRHPEQETPVQQGCDRGKLYGLDTEMRQDSLLASTQVARVLFCSGENYTGEIITEK